MSTNQKGDKLEDALYDYLQNQQRLGPLVYDAYPSQLCKIYKKKKYYCKEREDNVTFDVVIEFSLPGHTDPHLYVVFECKNHKRSIEDIYLREFSDKIGGIFGHACKGIIVVSSRLNSGAEKVAKNRRMGIVKYDEHGLDVIAPRKGGVRPEKGFVKSQIFEGGNPAKSLKFSAYYDGIFFSSTSQFLGSLDPSLAIEEDYPKVKLSATVTYISDEEIQQSAQRLIAKIGYQGGPVDLARICSMLSLDLTYTQQTILDTDGLPVLGSANFDHKSIQIHSHNNPHRERFTLGHEIGHFYLRHDRYLHSETIAEQDLLITSTTKNAFNYERLEIQANIFASDLLLPAQILDMKIKECGHRRKFKNIGYGYIYVDDQECNYGPYNLFLSELSSYFEVSLLAIEMKLRKMGLLTDDRTKPESFAEIMHHSRKWS